MKKRKKYAVGTKVTNYIKDPNQALMENNRNLALSKLEAQTDPLVQGLDILGDVAISTGSKMVSKGIGKSGLAEALGGSDLAFSFQDLLSGSVESIPQLMSMFATGGEVTEGIPIEAEGGEVVEVPGGEPTLLKGSSHEEGGVNLNVPEGTEIFSKRLKGEDGKSMAERKLEREKQISKLEKALEKNPHDKTLAKTLARVKKNNEIIENKDMQVMESAKSMTELMGKYMFGGNVKKYANGTSGIDSTGTPIDRYWDTFTKAIASIESKGKDPNKAWDYKGGYNNHYMGRYQLGKSALKDAAKFLGESVPSEKEFLGSKELQNKFFKAFTESNYRTLSKLYPEFKNLNDIEKMEALAYAHNQGAGGAIDWLKSGRTDSKKDGFGTDGSLFADTFSSYVTNNPPSNPSREEIKALESKRQNLMMSINLDSEGNEVISYVPKSSFGDISDEEVLKEQKEEGLVDIPKVNASKLGDFLLKTDHSENASLQSGISDQGIDPTTTKILSDSISNTKSTEGPIENKIDYTEFLPKIGNILSGIGAYKAMKDPMESLKDSLAASEINENMYEGFGEDALATIRGTKENLKAITDEQLLDIDRSGAAAMSSNRKSARGVNQMRALDLATQANINKSKSDVKSNYLAQLMGVDMQEASLQNQRDQMVMQGAEKADIANRQDLASFYNNLMILQSANASNLQTLGKTFNNLALDEETLGLTESITKNFGRDLKYKKSK